MATDQDTADREEAAAARASAHGYAVSKYLGPDDLPYVLQTESGLTLDQLEELLRVVESGALVERITQLQAVQKANPPSSDAWREASEELAPLFAEMARRTNGSEGGAS